MIEPAEPTLRRRLRAPPIAGRGEVRTFRLRLFEDGATKVFIVAAYGRRQAAELFAVREDYLKKNGLAATADDRDRAEPVPGQVWVREPGAPNFTKWRHQPGTTWG